jgi:hypothetical protein
MPFLTNEAWPLMIEGVAKTSGLLYAMLLQSGYPFCMLFFGSVILPSRGKISCSAPEV